MAVIDLESGGKEAEKQPESRRIIDLDTGEFVPLDETPIPPGSPREELEGFPGASVVEPIMTMGSGYASQVAGGVLGAISKGTAEDAANIVTSVQEAGTYMPRTEKGQAGLNAAAGAVEDVAEFFGVQDAGRRLGGYVLDKTESPAAAALTEGVIGVAPDLLALKGTNSARRFSAREIDEDAAQILTAGERHGVPVLHSDANPPSSFMGRMMQQFSEKMGPMGSGTAREAQQVARQSAIEEMALEFDVALDSDDLSSVVSSLNRESARRLETASATRKLAVDSLVKHGKVPVKNAIKAIDLELAKQARLGAKANNSLVKNLNDTREALLQDGMDFSVVKDIRTELIEDGMTIARSEDRRAAGSISSVKRALDADIKKFATEKDRTAAAQWLSSNRHFADIFGDIRETELKRILKTGDAKPEQIMTILNGGKRSELNRLYSNLDEAGRKSARSSIVQGVLERSGFFNQGPNPNRLANEMGRPKAMQAVDVFFQGEDKKVLIGLRKLLNATRRGQDASAAPATGIQAIPFLAGGGLTYGWMNSPILTGSVALTAMSVAKAYESKPFRNLMLKIASTSKSRPVKPALLEAGMVALVGGLKASTSAQESTETVESSPSENITTDFAFDPETGEAKE